MVITKATEYGYFGKDKINPCAGIIISKKGTQKMPKKEKLTESEFFILFNSTNCRNIQVKQATLFSLATGLAWTDVKHLEWKNIEGNKVVGQRQKTGEEYNNDIPDLITLPKRLGKNILVFRLPTANGANKILKQWVKDCTIDKKITWHCLRYSFSNILLKNRTDVPTVAGLMAHSDMQTMTRYQQSDSEAKQIAISQNHPFSSKYKSKAVVVQKVVDDKAAARIEYIKELKLLGFTVDEIKEELKKL